MGESILESISLSNLLAFTQIESMCTRPCGPLFALNVHLPLNCPQCALVGLLNKACFKCQTPQPDILQGTAVATDSTAHSFSFHCCVYSVIKFPHYQRLLKDSQRFIQVVFRDLNGIFYILTTSSQSKSVRKTDIFKII